MKKENSAVVLIKKTIFKVQEFEYFHLIKQPLLYYLK